MPSLVIAEHDNSTLNPATRPTVTAAQALGEEVHVLIAGEGSTPVAEAAAALSGVSKVLHADDPLYAHPLAEPLAELIAPLCKTYSHVLAPADTFGKNVMPRIAALIDSQQVSDIIAVIDPETFKRPFYAGNAIATVRCNDPVKVVTVRPTAFAPAEDGGKAEIETLSAGADPGLSSFVDKTESRSDRPDLATARVVVSGGRGLGSAENFRLIEALAAKLNAAVGASRAAVDAGFVPNEYQVGQTGKVVAPDLYIAVGISGAIQHLAGMSESKVIVAINKDEEAPIFEIADYGLVGDLFEILPALSASLDS